MALEGRLGHCFVTFSFLGVVLCCFFFLLLLFLVDIVAWEWCYDSPGKYKISARVIPAA